MLLTRKNEHGRNAQLMKMRRKEVEMAKKKQKEERRRTKKKAE